MSIIQSANDSLRRSNRRILVTGPRASGKTVLSVSASRLAPDEIPSVKAKRERIDCHDTLVIQGDNEGIMGAVDAGLVPKYILDMCDVIDWEHYTKRLATGLRELQTLLTDGTIRVLVMDLGLPARLIDRSINPAVQKDWKEVAIQGGRLFNSVAGLKGVTVIGNAQLKAAVSPGETVISADAATAKAIGGERSTFTVDLPKGIATHWLDNASFVFARDAKRVRDAKGETTRVFKTFTQSSSKFEAKSRAESLLSPTEPGEKSLNSLLQRAYGEDY